MTKGTRKCRAGVGTDIISFIEACHSVASTSDFSLMVNSDLKRLIPHTMFACGLFCVDNLRMAHILNVSFPDDYLNQILAPDKSLLSGVAKRWTHYRHPVFYETTILDNNCEDKRWLSAISDHEIHNIAGHGLVDIHGKFSSYFGLAGLACWDDQSALTLEITVPHMHVTLLKLFVTSATNNFAKQPVALREGDPIVLQKTAYAISLTDTATGTSGPDVRLSSREQQVLYWVSRGKSNLEIGMILGISRWTVKIHIRNVMAKLTASTRAQAVAAAIELGVPLSAETEGISTDVKRSST